MNSSLVFASNGMSLSLQEAESLAIGQDPRLSEIRLKSQALQESAIAAGTLPDPKLKFGMMNFPTDTFDREQEAMTQIQLGVVQMFPGGDTLQLKSDRMIVNAKGESARAAARQRNVIQQVRMNWLDVYYWQHAVNVVAKNRKLFKQTVKVTESLYAVGRRKQQDVLRAELELGLLDDRETQVITMVEMMRANLAKLIGQQAAYRPLSTTFPSLPDIPNPEISQQRLAQHPLLEFEQARVDASQKDVAIARQAYKPAWLLDVTYGFRDGYNPDGSERADFLSAMVMMDVPLFTGKRQDKKLSANKLKHQASLYAREDRVRELNKAWEVSNAEWLRLGERVRLFETSLLSKARENSKASLHAYQNDQGDFSSLMRARIMEFETELKALRMRVDYAKSQAKLLYLVGDEK
ncbi:MAG: TolC family protein [Gammaproteobacteria bacterium]|nr:TolC family protein [Gammaproteobacteria bacterium]